MAITISTKDMYLPPNVRTLLLPVASVLILVFLSTLVLKTAFSKVNLSSLRMQKLQKDEQVYKQKQVFLQEIKEQTLSQSDAALTALPEDNPALIGMSQLKNLAESTQVILKEIALGSEDKTSGEIEGVLLSFDATGTFENILKFLRTIQGAAPIARLDTVKISQQSESISAIRASLKVYWSSFPGQIPAINEPIKQLTSSEQEVLVRLMELKPPPFFPATPATSLPSAQPQVPSTRKNPFSI